MEKQPKEYMKDMSFGEKLSYLWMYHKNYLLVGLVILLAIASVVRTRTQQQAKAFQVFWINSGAGDSVEESMQEEFAAYAEIPESIGEVVVNTTLSLAPGSQNSQYDLATIDHIEIEEEKKELDLIIADAWNFEFLTAQASIRDLREVLTEEQLSKYESNLYYIDLVQLREEQQKQREDSSYFGEYISGEDAVASETRGVFKLPDPDTMEEPVPVGIRVSEFSKVEAYGLYPNTEAILGFAANSSRIEQSVQFLEFLD